MNVDTGKIYHGDKAIKEAQDRGERLIPAIVIPVPPRKQAPKYGPRKPLREVRRELQAKAATEA